MSDWQTAVHYRNRAEILRTIADEIEDDDHMLSLRKAAIHLDKLADTFERQARSATT